MNQVMRSNSTSIRTKVVHAAKLTKVQWGIIRCFDFYEAIVTEKTDGMAYEVGYDSSGFYTATATSGHIYHANDYIVLAKQKFGKDVDLSISRKFSDLHLIMSMNKPLLTYLTSFYSQTGGYADAAIRGEMFYLGDQVVGPDGLVSFVATKYDAACMGLAGMFVVHTQLEINKHLPAKYVSRLSDDLVVFDHDLVDMPKLNVRFNDFGILDPADFDFVLRRKLNTIKPKWGPETEGYVLHSCTKTQPLIKVIDPEFMSRKHARYNKPNS
jgi:hypothetical protein